MEREILMHLRVLKKTQREVFLEDPISRDGEGNEVTLVALSQRRAGRAGILATRAHRPGIRRGEGVSREGHTLTVVAGRRAATAGRKWSGPGWGCRCGLERPGPRAARRPPPFILRGRRW